MSDPSLHHLVCPDAAGGHRMAFWQWGQRDSPHLVLCVHGLTRQGRDFDVLARALCAQASQTVSSGIRVICVDVAGRGESDWLKDPALYQVPAYAADMLALLVHLHAQAPITHLDWVGTSMGGLIGLVVCGQAGLAMPAPVRKLVLNDVGPALEWGAIQRIGKYVGQAGHFDTLQEAADAMWAISRGFGPHTQAQWLALSAPMVRPVSALPGSRLRLHYDPAIAESFKLVTEEGSQQGEAALWHLYDAIEADTLVLRGAESDLLSLETARAMTQRGPRARLVEFEGVGHAPTLVADDQTAAVAGFLLL